MFQMMGVFAEFERAMIQERVKSGLAPAPPARGSAARRSIPRGSARSARRCRPGRRGMIKIAARFGVGVGTVQRIKADLGTNPDLER
jgi:DNA invertase Pin-like site-specific DNA recombinase